METVGAFFALIGIYVVFYVGTLAIGEIETKIGNRKYQKYLKERKDRIGL